MARLFDAFVMVDWSAAAKPTSGPNSVWVGVYARDARLKFRYQAANPPTRLEARKFIDDMVARLTSRGDKVLVGFDFSFGYPAGTAAAAGLETAAQPAWLAMQKHLAGRVKEKADNSNARFALAASLNYAISKGPYPFWGVPKRDQATTLAPKKPAFDDTAPLPEYRRSEAWVRSRFKAKPKSVWQIYGAGSVGGQSLLGIPTLHHLRNEIPASQIWPFETGFRMLTEEILDGTQVVFAEVYPSLVKPDPEPGEVLDRAQLRAIATHLASLDEKGRLGALFAPPADMDIAAIPAIESEEGWILAG